MFGAACTSQFDYWAQTFSGVVYYTRLSRDLASLAFCSRFTFGDTKAWKSISEKMHCWRGILNMGKMLYLAMYILMSELDTLHLFWVSDTAPKVLQGCEMSFIRLLCRLVLKCQVCQIAENSNCHRSASEMWNFLSPSPKIVNTVVHYFDVLWWYKLIWGTFSLCIFLFIKWNFTPTLHLIMAVLKREVTRHADRWLQIQFLIGNRVQKVEICRTTPPIFFVCGSGGSLQHVTGRVRCTWLWAGALWQVEMRGREEKVYGSRLMALLKLS